jgi:hypothetical protein
MFQAQHRHASASRPSGWIAASAQRKQPFLCVTSTVFEATFCKVTFGVLSC